MSNSRKTHRVAAAVAVAVCAVMAFAALGGVGLAQTAGGPGGSQYGKKVKMCHKGKKTITVSRHAVPAHLRHGDTLGSCASAAAHKGKSHKAKDHQAHVAKSAAKAKAKAERAKANDEKKADEKPEHGKGKGK